MLSGPVDLLVFRALTFVCIERCEITSSEEWSFDTHICCIYYLGWLWNIIDGRKCSGPLYADRGKNMNSLDFSGSVKARVPLSRWREPMPWCVNGFIALLSKFQDAQVFLNSVNIQEKYVALDFLRSEVTSFLALLYSCHNLGLLDEMACLSNLYLRFL